MTTNPTATRIPITPNPGYSVFRLDPPLDGHETVATIETDGSNRHGLHAGIYPADPATGGHADLALAEYWGLGTPVDALRRAGYEIQWVDDPEPDTATAIVVPDTWAWTTDADQLLTLAVATPNGQEQPTITARIRDAVEGIQLIHLGSVPATWVAGARSGDIVALDLWGDPERPGRVWAVDRALGQVLRHADEVYANPNTEHGQQDTPVVAVTDGTAVAGLAPVKVTPWAQPGTEAAIEALTAGDAELEPAPGAVA